MPATRPWRRLGWVTLPLLAVLAVPLSHGLRGTAQRTFAVDRWNALEPWLPSVLPARVGYAVAPWPALLTAATMLTIGLALAALSTLVLRSTDPRPRWRRFLLLWGSVVLAAVATVAAAQLGDVLQMIADFGGRGGSTIRLFTLPALGEAVRWGLI